MEDNFITNFAKLNFAPVYGMSILSRGPMDRWAYRAILALASAKEALDLAAASEKIKFNLVGWRTHLLPRQVPIFNAAMDEFCKLEGSISYGLYSSSQLGNFKKEIERCPTTEEKYDFFLSTLQVLRKRSSDFLDQYKWFQFKMESLFGPPPRCEMLQLMYEISIVEYGLHMNVRIRDEFMSVYRYRKLLVDVEADCDSQDPELCRLDFAIFKLFSTASDVRSKIPTHVYFSEKDVRYTPTMQLLKDHKKELFSLVDRSNSTVKELISCLQRELEDLQKEKHGHVR